MASDLRVATTGIYLNPAAPARRTHGTRWIAVVPCRKVDRGRAT
jgi:hypothetical protein